MLDDPSEGDLALTDLRSSASSCNDQRVVDGLTFSPSPYALSHHSSPSAPLPCLALRLPSYSINSSVLAASSFPSTRMLFLRSNSHPLSLLPPMDMRQQHTRTWFVLSPDHRRKKAARSAEPGAAPTSQLCGSSSCDGTPDTLTRHSISSSLTAARAEATFASGSGSCVAQMAGEAGARATLGLRAGGGELQLQAR